LKVVVVAFKVTEEDSVYYKKLDVKLKEGIYIEDPKVLARALWAAYFKGADFVSVRFIRENLFVKLTDAEGKDLPPRVPYPKAAVEAVRRTRTLFHEDVSA